jgi:hypothetical protein
LVEKVKVAVMAHVDAGGPESIVVSGPSTVHW